MLQESRIVGRKKVPMIVNADHDVNAGSMGNHTRIKSKQFLR